MPVMQLFRRARGAEAGRRLYGAAVAQARQPAFYRDLGVPDTLDGRFELVALHVYLILRRLRQEEAAEGQFAARGMAQALFDIMFADMDQNLRELGVSDLSVGPKVKRMAQGFYGRIAAYDRGLAEGDAVLAEALRRNLFGTAAPAPERIAAMAAYLRREADGLTAVSLEALRQGGAAFGPPPCPIPDVEHAQAS